MHKVCLCYRLDCLYHENPAGGFMEMRERVQTHLNLWECAEQAAETCHRSYLCFYLLLMFSSGQAGSYFSTNVCGERADKAEAPR